MNVDLKFLLRLYGIPKVGPSRIKALIQHFSSYDEIRDASLHHLCSVPGINKGIAKLIKSHDTDEFVKQQLKLINRHNVSVITWWDDKYPENLKSIHDPPVLLFIRGNYNRDDRISVAVVGTRNPSSYGKLVTERLCSALVSSGITIVSGLARGIDSNAHQIAVDSGGRTIAVLGSGVDVLYPRENSRLARRIFERGAVISEFPMGTGPDAPNFPRRNRVIAGISLFTLVVEAGKGSGAIITAHYAREYGRTVFAVPGPITSRRSTGTNQLISGGAILVQAPEDILREVEKVVELPGVPRQMRMDLDLTEKERKLFSIFGEEPLHVDFLAREMRMAPGEMLSLLLQLELRSLIKQLPGKFFVKI